LDTTKANAAAAFNSVTSGPVAQNVKDHTAKASSEFSNLAASRRTPENSAATGQPLTHYHSFFQELLSWNNPRASGIALASIITFIFTTRYLDVTRYALKASYLALGTTVAAEVGGKFVMKNGLATQLRPRQYYTVSRESIDSLVGDVHELVNFIVIESQRILFVENTAASATAAILAFVTYHLTKLVPYWGLAVIGTVLAFVAPLVYVTNKELIDHHLKNATDVVGAQTAQMRTVAQQQVDQVATLGKQYAGDYTGKVQGMLRGGSPKATKTEFPSPPAEEPEKAADLPEVPKEPVGAEEPVAL
jgi:hypothetical protein